MMIFVLYSMYGKSRGVTPQESSVSFFPSHPHPLDFPHFHQYFKIIYVLATLFSVFSSRRRWPCGQSVRLVSGGRRFESRPRQTKVFKLVVVISPLKLRIMGIALRLFRQCQDNGLIKFWLKLVFWICEPTPLHN